MARKGRDYAAEYKRRQAKARREGYTGYYGKRIRGGKPPSAPAPTGAALKKARGHASASDLAREAGPGWFVSAFPIDRDDAGRWQRVRLDVIDDQGVEHEYWLSGSQLDEEELERIADELIDEGVRFSPQYDIRNAYAKAA